MVSEEELRATVERIGFDSSLTEKASEWLMAQAIALMPCVGDWPVVEHWAGLRPGSPDDLPIGEIGLRELPPNWHDRDAYTRRLGDAWLDGRGGALLRVPSVIVQLPSADDRNLMINHRHPDVRRIEIIDATPFDLDARLFAA